MENALHKEYQRWCENVKEPLLAQELADIKGKEAEIEDRFSQELAFGTAGLRGVMGAGTNRMNIYSIRRVTRGLADYLNSVHKGAKVAISFDSRLNSKEFAAEVASVLSKNGIEAWIYSGIHPTPMLSFTVRRLGCQAGVMVTASHNPSKYNGYKVYDADGCQIGEDVADAILAKIDGVDYFAQKRPEEEGKEVAVQVISQQVEEDFYNVVLAQRMVDAPPTDITIAYTPLHGTGLVPVTTVLNRAGYTDIQIVEEQAKPDGTFPTASYPNPEMEPALELGVKLLQKTNAAMLLATDPDSDRVGVVSSSSNGPVHLNGNEIGVLLLDYLCRHRIATGRMPANPIAVDSVVSSEMARIVAEHYGVEMREVLTGFKHIAGEIAVLEKTGEGDRFIFGFEESVGYMVGSYVRDKDAVGACLIASDLAAECKANGQTLFDAMEDLYNKFGFYLSGLLTFQFEGPRGSEEMAARMRAMRSQSPAQLCGSKVVRVRDFLWDENNPLQDRSLPSSNVLKFWLEDGTSVCMRPSGTEPKLKIYCTVNKKTRAEAEKAIAEYLQSLPKMVKD
ncbi:MAG: phospho-sugar mutase [Oscillospiraceae bacterium]